MAANPNTILDFGFWIVKALPVGSFTNSNVASLNPNGIGCVTSPVECGFTPHLTPRRLAIVRRVSREAALAATVNLPGFSSSMNWGGALLMA